MPELRSAQWYGGHNVLGYSLLFAPLAALAGPVAIGVIAALASVALFIPLARAVAHTREAASVAAWLFVWRRLPELTGHSLEDIERHLQDGKFKPADFAGSSNR